MAGSDRLITLLEVLRRRTGNGAAKWTTGSRDDTYIWSGSSASVALLSKDNDGWPPYMVRLIDATGRVIEEELFDGDNRYFLLVQNLYSEARSDALDITAAIDSLLEDLGGEDEVPF